MVVFVALGYLLGLPAAWWCWNDLARFRRPLWVGFGNRDGWRRGVIAGLVAFGWGAVIVALSWRTGRTRPELIAEVDRMADLSDVRSSEP